MPKVTLKNDLFSEEVTLIKETYKNGALALLARDKYGCPFTTLSVNIRPASDVLPPDQCFFKNYSENEGFLECCIEAGAIELTGESIPTGFVTVPLVKVLF